MVARGHVHNGVVVLDGGVRLPEGQEVTVLANDGSLTLPPKPAAVQHSILDVPPVSLGPVLHPFTDNDDFLGEMLEGRP